MPVPKKRIRGRRARLKQRGHVDLRSRYRPSDLPPDPDLSVIELDDPYASPGWINPEGALDLEARLKPARRADGSVAAGEGEWVAPSRPRIRVVARLKEDPLGRMAARRQIDRAQFLGGREYQELYDTTRRGHVRSVDLTKTKVDFARVIEPLTERHRWATRRLESVDRAVAHRHGEVGLALVRAVLCERVPVEQTARLYGATSSQTRSVAWLFRQVLNVVAKALGFSTSTARPYQMATTRKQIRLTI